MTLADELLPSTAAAAKFIGIPEREVYYLVEKGRLPVIRKGRRLYYRKGDLNQAFLSDTVANDQAAGR